MSYTLLRYSISARVELFNWIHLITFMQMQVLYHSLLLFSKGVHWRFDINSSLFTSLISKRLRFLGQPIVEFGKPIWYTYVLLSTHPWTLSKQILPHRTHSRLSINQHPQSTLLLLIVPLCLHPNLLQQTRRSNKHIIHRPLQQITILSRPCLRPSSTVSHAARDTTAVSEFVFV